MEPSPSYVWQPVPKFRDRIWVHALLFLLTVLTTTLVGVNHYLGFMSDFGARRLPHLTTAAMLVRGFWYSGTILAILGVHELGHYLACRYYDVDASRPFFLPMPFILTGTLGAFIRIREPIPAKRMLFDIGIAGPIAGFLIAVPALFMGLAMSDVARIPPGMTGFELGEPLLFKLASWLIWGTPPRGFSVNMHPMAFAAWFGLLATALNLFPIGQLDGGHISYTVLGRKSSTLTVVMIGIAIVLTWFSLSWLVWTVLMIGMLRVFGRHHPPVPDEHVPLDRTRQILAAFALAMFVLCFTPVPFSSLEVIRR
ncbi:MAG TPA: site-2 protease family protein [Vicinamibacterales bacterium]|nr:site-2 protease family protein [Vicinamibacterales bacterium]